VNRVIQGDCEEVLKGMPGRTVDLVFTSPPYFNSREYVTYPSYDVYLSKMRAIFEQCSRVLKEGAFLVVNSSPVLIPREGRTKESRRVPIPFDLHNQATPFFNFVDDIIWEKPEGAGWTSGRGRRFAADRSPMQYKAVPVTEYVMVYRNRTDKLIDWNIHQKSEATIERSKITGEYDVTNVWRLPPARDKRHPAVFPFELAERVIRYYSFVGDLVMDPFAGTGTTGKAATKLQRKFLLIEKEKPYLDAMRNDFSSLFACEDVEFKMDNNG
jgi:DNA modification methylase